MLLTDEEIAQRIAGRTAGDGDTAGVPAPTARRQYRYVRPFAEAGEALIDTTLNTEGRFMFGIPDLDLMLRGVRPGDLCYVNGRAHSGKTQLVLNAVDHNRDQRVLWFTPDEVAELVLSKLIGLRHGINSEVLEERIKARDQYAMDMVRATAREDYANLLVVDDTLGFDRMHRAYAEACDYWGDEPTAIVVDFLEIVPGDETEDGGVQQKSERVKAWGKEVHKPMIVLRQNKKGGAPRGQAQGMDGMRYGGETEATQVIEVYRKREDASLEPWDRMHHENTVTINVDKNKRPPCKKGEIDLFIDASNGRIRPLHLDDFGVLERELTREPVYDAAHDVQRSLL